MNHIKKEFDGLGVLKDISLSVEEGEILSIIGPSGSGKSTLLRCATMLEEIDGGEILVVNNITHREHFLAVIQPAFDYFFIYIHNITIYSLIISLSLQFSLFQIQKSSVRSFNTRGKAITFPSIQASFLQYHPVKCHLYQYCQI